MKVNSYQLHVSASKKGHLQLVHLVKRAVQYTMCLLSDDEISLIVSYNIQLI